SRLGSRDGRRASARESERPKQSSKNQQEVGFMSATATGKLVSDRINRIEISATLAVVNEASQLRAKGANLVDFGAGEPHFSTPRHIKDAAIAAINNDFTKYTAVAGIPELREAIVKRHATDL